MTARPLIFVSAVTRELRSARQLVVNTLMYLGYQPVWQDIFGMESGDLRAVLREKLDQCKGVIQLVGQEYGHEPPTPDAKFGRVSYTQYEALYARTRGKKVWYLVIDAKFPVDPHDPESDDERRQLQVAYRRRVESDADVFHPLTNQEGLDARVLRLRDDLESLRRGVKRWAGGVVVLLVLILSVCLLILYRSIEMGKLLRKGNSAYVEEKAKILREQPSQPPAEVEDRTYAALAQRLGVDQKVLRERLPEYARELSRSPRATSLERANAAYVSKDYKLAHQLALAAAGEAKENVPPDRASEAKAYTLAALSDGWIAAVWKAGGNLEIVTDQTRNSPWSFKISATEPNHLRWVQLKRLEPHAEYLLTAWIRTENVAHAPSNERDDRGANAAIQFMSPRQDPRHSEAVFGTNDWRRVSLRFATGDAVEIEVQLQLGGYSSTTTGTAWFADVEFTKL